MTKRILPIKSSVQFTVVDWRCPGAVAMRPSQAASFHRPAALAALQPPPAAAAAAAPPAGLAAAAVQSARRQSRRAAKEYSYFFLILPMSIPRQKQRHQ